MTLVVLAPFTTRWELPGVYTTYTVSSTAKAHFASASSLTEVTGCAPVVSRVATVVPQHIFSALQSAHESLSGCVLTKANSHCTTTPLLLF